MQTVCAASLVITRGLFTEIYGFKRFGRAMSKQKQKGTRAENQVVEFLKRNGFPYAERRALAGVNDKGDVTGIGPVVIEVKDHQKITLSEFMSELKEEVNNAGAQTGVAVVKRRGTLQVGDWYAVMPVSWWVDLLKEAGY
jgi:Holliday junction resolvase